MEHFVTLSNLDSKIKKRIIHDKLLLHEMVPKLLHKKGQGREDFDVAGLVKKYSLLSFSFVRHPFERYGIKECNKLHVCKFVHEMLSF